MRQKNFVLSRRWRPWDRDPVMEGVTGPQGFDLEAAWDAEWERNLWNATLARVKTRLKPKQFQMFGLYALKEWPLKEVARARREHDARSWE